MIVFVATPLAAVAVPVPVTVPAPEALAKVTTVVLSEVTVLPAASWIVAVSTRVAPEVRLVVAPVSAIWAAAPWTTVKAPSVPVVSPAAVASIVTEPTSAPVIVLVATPLAAVAVPVPVTVPAPDGLGEGDDGRAVAGDGVAGRVLDRRGEDAGGAGGEVGGRAGERDLRGGAVDDGEGAERAGGESRRRWLPSSTEPTSAPVIVLVATPLAAVAVPVPRDGAGARLLGEVDDGGAVGGDGVAGGVLDRRGQDAGRAGGEVGGRAGERDLGGGAVDDGEGAERAGGEAGRGRLHDDRADERRR